MAIFQNTVSIKKLGRVCSCDVKSGTCIDNKLVFYTTERVEVCFNRIFCRFYGTFSLNFKWKVSSSFTDPNDSQAESENNFLASYMMELMEVEDDNV